MVYTNDTYDLMKMEILLKQANHRYHMHLFSSAGRRMQKIHIQITKTVYDTLIKLFK